MNAKEYELIASKLSQVGDFTRLGTNDDYLDGKYDTWYMTVVLLTGAFEQNYPNFDRTKFLTACGIEEK